MFTAKTMVDDKVAGFEAGVDDYLTKPTHPAELTAHIKAVLGRAAQTQTVPSEKARIIAFIGARGGMGTTTLALNTSIAFQQDNDDVIFAELNPGHGTVALELGITNAAGLANLLNRSLKDIHLRSVEGEIVNHTSGIRLLVASHAPNDVELEQSVSQMEAIVTCISSMCKTVVLDLGCSMRPYVKPILKHCDRLILAVEPVFPSNVLGRSLLQELSSDGIPQEKINLALINRVRSKLQIPFRQVETEINIEMAGIVSPAPDLAYEASTNSTPLIIAHPDSLMSDQIRKLSQFLSQRVKRVVS
jgi:pilus assembly protein CpaE